MQLCNPAWSPFETLINIKTVVSDDEPGEIFFVYHLNDIPMCKIQELCYVARFLDRQYLCELPFMLIYSDSHHGAYIGWNAWLPPQTEWESMLESENQGIIVANAMAKDLIISESPDNTIYDLDCSKIDEYYKKLNLFLFTVNSPDD